MRDYGKVHTTFWTSATVRGMSENARILAFYLLTSPHSTIAGVFRLPDGYVCEDLQWSAERVAKGFTELLAKGFANRCETTKWVWVREHLKWNPPENPNQRKSAAKVAHAVPSECAWNVEFMRVCGPTLGLEPLPEENPSETVPKGFLNQEQKQKQEQKQEGSFELLPGLEAATLPAPAALIPLVDGTEHRVEQVQATEWQLAYPAIDVVGELGRIRVWCNANKANRKTASGVERFLVRWLSKAQNDAGSGGGQRGRRVNGGYSDDWTARAT